MRIRALAFSFALMMVAAGCDSSSSSPPPTAEQATPAVSPVPAPAPAPGPIAPVPITPANTVQLNGRVTHAGQPVARAVVVPSERGSGLVPEGIDPSQLLTGPDGRFSIQLPAGDYDLRIVGAEWSSQTTVDLTQGPRDLGDMAVSENARAILDMVDTGSPR